MSGFKHTKFSFVHPKGAIKSKGEVIDIINQAKMYKEVIALYTVNQSGSISKYLLDETCEYTPNPKPQGGKSGMCAGPGFDSINVRIVFDSGKSYSNEILMGSYAITDNTYGTKHRMFDNKKFAEEYSAALKGDADYMQSVEDWHNECREMFHDYEDYDDDNF